jgi:curved DNA-binding protein CbpA
VKPLAQQTHYELLEIPTDAPAGEVDAAYARARALYGPDSIATYTLLAPDEAELLRARLEEARTTLLDPEARARYDERLATLAAAVPAPSSAWAPPRDPPAATPIQLLAAAPDEEDEADEPSELAAAAPPPPAHRASTPTPGGAPIRLEREVSRPAMTPPPVAVPAPSASPSGVAYVPEATSWTGEVLRNVREARGISIQQISERTKVSRHHIESIEADRFAALPAPVYLRGILLGLARELRLDGQKVARSYLERMAAASGAPTPASRR